MSEPYAKEGELIVTEDSKTPVYIITRDVYPTDAIRAEDFKSMCTLEDPVHGEAVRTHYNGERFCKTEMGHIRFHFEDGWR